MIDTGYLFSNEPGRLFVNTSLGCTANCSYCYLPNLKYSNCLRIIYQGKVIIKNTQ